MAEERSVEDTRTVEAWARQMSQAIEEIIRDREARRLAAVQVELAKVRAAIREAEVEAEGRASMTALIRAMNTLASTVEGLVAPLPDNVSAASGEEHEPEVTQTSGAEGVGVDKQA
jgi:hypothetical protein